ncbi:MAG: hypothetical protein CMG78_09610 [Marinobacter sp.]|nr:hypothetical protein [Marinobacter sp.]|tara:strand:- start:654 stop:1238 length:585 start_codon:yes stop_codon:yes gene_type:complete
MIELPSFATNGSASPMFMDAGFTQRGVQSLSRIDRKGSRYKIAFSFGPFTPSQGNIMVARLIAGKQAGLRVKYPLLTSQGSPGSPVIDGAITNPGRIINIRGLTPGYVCSEGFWLSLGKGDRHYLHSVGIGGTADASGLLQIELNELLRDTFPDGANVYLAQPMVEGIVEGDAWQWQLSVDRVIPIEFTIEEVR